MESDSPAVIEATHRLCVHCNQVRALGEFLSADDMTCKHCHAIASAQEANRQLEEVQAILANSTLQQLAVERNGTRIDAPHISEAVALVVQKLGGLDHLMGMYADSLKASWDADKGSRKTLDHLWKLMQLITASTEHRQTAPDVEGLTEDEIIAEYQTLALNAVMTHADQFRVMIGLIREKAPELLLE